MSAPQIIILEIPCLTCQGFNYFEEETGYYSCSNCGTVSQIRCGTELDYTFPMKTMKSKVRNNEDDEIISDDGNMIEDINELYSQKYSFEGETLMNISTTNIKSSRGYETSTFNDLSSIYSRSMRKKIILTQKTPQEKLIEIQENFTNIIKLIINDFFENKNKEKSKINFYNKNIKFDIYEKRIIFEITKRLWINFVSIKYKNIISSNSKRKKLVRSRTNSINDEKEIKKNKTKENDNNKNKINKNFFMKKKLIKKKEKINELIKLRRITERNVFYIFNVENENKINNKSDFYNEKNFNASTNKLISLKKFIEEYDEVINFIKKDKCFDIIFETEEDKEKINISNIIEYEQLIKVCNELGINTKKEKNYLINEDNYLEEDLSFEALIHLIFVKQQLKYKNNFGENNVQITNEINSNHFLFLIYQIFHYKKIYLLLNEILFLYNNYFYVYNLSFEEINFLFLKNNKKLKAHINWFDNKLDNSSILKKAEYIIDKITNYIFKMPDIFNFLCKYILKILHNNGKIKLIFSTKYNIEYICLGIIFFCLKIIYGLNDLPYICLLLNNINKKYLEYDDIDLNEKLKIFTENTKNDKLCKIYKLFPSELELIKFFIDELKLRNINSLLINSNQRKLTYNKEYKNKYIETNLNHLYKNFYDDFSQDINELENKSNKTKIKNNNNNKKMKRKSWKIYTTKQFKNKIDLIENPPKEYNPFIKEEFNFHKSIYKSKDSNVEFPLPLDTYIRMKKHSQKILINYHRPSEMIFLYLFSEFFKIDYLSLRTITRLIEYYIEKIYQ